MADLGTIGGGTPVVFNHNTKTVSGVVTEFGVPAPRRCVRMYLHSSGALVTQNYSRQDGTFALATLRTLEGQAVYVVALNDESALSFNPLLFDKLIPV